VVRARGAERRERLQLGPGQEIQHDVGVGVVAHLRAVGGDQAADHRGERRRPRVPLFAGQRFITWYDGAERLRRAPLIDELLRGTDDLQRVGFALVACGAPGRYPVPAQDHADGPGIRSLHGGDVQAKLEAGPPPRHPHDPVAEYLLGERLAIGGGGQGDAGVRVQVVDVGGVHEAVHGGVDGRGGAAAAVQAVVERGDHLVLALDARIDVDQRAQPVQPQHGEAGLGQRAEVAAGALDPDQISGSTGHRIGGGGLDGGVAAGVVGVARVGAEPVAALDQRLNLGMHRRHAPQPACCPPARSARMRST
jgi:hypothetical protein